MKLIKKTFLVLWLKEKLLLVPEAMDIPPTHLLFPIPGLPHSATQKKRLTGLLQKDRPGFKMYQLDICTPGTQDHIFTS